MQGELYLARSRRRRVQPGPLPPDLLAASHDANVFTRLGAVSELRARLLGDNLPAAAGAHQRLAEMAEQDISYVAAAAAAAVDDGALGCEPLEVSFGRVPQGAGSPVLRVTTTGPPLARTCALETSDPRIRVAEDGDGVAVSVDTSAAGSVRGTVTLRGPLGTHLVHVSADVEQETADQPARPVEPTAAVAPAAAATAAALPDVVPTAAVPASVAVASPVPLQAAPAAEASTPTPVHPTPRHPRADRP